MDGRALPRRRSRASLTQRTAGTPPEAAVQFDIGSTNDSLARMQALFVELGDVYRVYAPGRKSYTVVINHPDDVERVLVSNHRNYVKGIGLDRVKILLGNGLMTSERELWRAQRCMMQPLFQRQAIAAVSETIAAVNERLLLRWERAADGGVAINLTDDLSELALEVVLRAIFGRDVDRLSQRPGGNPFAIITREPERNLQFAYEFRGLAAHVLAVVRRRRAENDERPDYLGMLMTARDRGTGAAMPEAQLVDEVMTLLVAGHETTASGLNWTWYLLSQDARVESCLHAELDRSVPGDRPALEAIRATSYAKQVIAEALRLYPPGWLLSRRAIAADVLGGYEIAAGTDVLLSPYLLHRHPRFWPDPDAFRPERFAPEHAAERAQFAYLPFAAGPRRCIGETFALKEMLTHLCQAARRFRLRLRPDEAPLEIDAQINLRARKPLFMTPERR